MKGGETLGNEEGSEETSEEGSEEEVSPTRIYTPGVRPLTSGVFLCPNIIRHVSPLVAGDRKRCASTCWVGQLDRERRRGAKQSEGGSRFRCDNRMFPGDQRPLISLEENLLNEAGVHGVA